MCRPERSTQRSRRRRANSASIWSPTAPTSPIDARSGRPDSRICKPWISSVGATFAPTFRRCSARSISSLGKWIGEDGRCNNADGSRPSRPASAGAEIAMAPRPLAEEQPASFAFTANNLAWAKDRIAKYPEGRQASAVIPLLWRAQEQAGGWLPQKAIEHVAELLGMARIRALEVATFYTMFNLAPVGQFHVQLCGTTPCMLRGSDALKGICERRIGEQLHVTAEGKFS